MVTTNALEMGIDVAEVRMGVQAGAPRRLRGHAQESGQGGRDGEASEAVMDCGKGSDGVRDGRKGRVVKRGGVKKGEGVGGGNRGVY